MFEQQVYSANPGSVDTFNFSPTGNTVAGRHLFVVLTIGSSRTLTSITDTHGHTWDIDVASGGARSTVIAKTQIVTPITTSDTITVNLSGIGACLVVAAEFSGLDTTPLDKFNSKNELTVTTGNTNTTGTLTSANQLVIVTIGWSGSTGTISSDPDGYTALTSPSVIFQILYKGVAATTALDESWTWATSRNYGACIATYELAPSTFVPRATFMF